VSLARLSATLDDLLSRPVFRRAHVGLAVQQAETGEILYQRAVDKRFTPGSTVKLVTAAVALEILGPAYRWSTRVFVDGPVIDGRLEGNVWLVGSGDPSLTRDELRALVPALRQHGIREIDGDVVADDRAFEPKPWGRGWMWDDLHIGFAGGVSGLQLSPNLVIAQLVPGRTIGEPVRLSYLEPGPKLPILVDARTGRARSEVELEVVPLPGAAEKRIIGSLPLGRSLELSLAPPHPTLYALAYLGTVLADSGITVGGRMRTVESRETIPPATKELAVIRSDSLGLVLGAFLKPSDNQIGESILRTVGRESAGEGSADSGIESVDRILRVWGIPADAAEVADGSGLSRYNQITPAALNRLLLIQWHHPTSDVLIDALPIAGVDGTLRWRMRGTVAEGNARAKTGALDAVRGLSGYVRDRDGRTIIFTLLVNGFEARGSEARAIEDLIIEQLALFSVSPPLAP
jgi:D-alanyl-D-alanine carboxypeptidase/D-alanyl-D-alanine-endopeptidase (penicillin-binding protein 4)